MSFPVLIFLGTSSGTHLGMIGTKKTPKIDHQTPDPPYPPLCQGFWGLGGFMWGGESSPRRHFGVKISPSGWTLGPNGVYTTFEVLHLGNPTTKWEGPTPHVVRDIHLTKIIIIYIIFFQVRPNLFTRVASKLIAPIVIEKKQKFLNYFILRMPNAYCDRHFAK